MRGCACNRLSPRQFLPQGRDNVYAAKLSFTQKEVPGPSKNPFKKEFTNHNLGAITHYLGNFPGPGTPKQSTLTYGRRVFCSRRKERFYDALALVVLERNCTDFRSRLAKKSPGTFSFTTKMVVPTSAQSPGAQETRKPRVMRFRKSTSTRTNKSLTS